MLGLGRKRTRADGKVSTAGKAVAKASSGGDILKGNCRAILLKLGHDPNLMIFHDPIDLSSFSDYRLVVPHEPMDFCTIDSRITRGEYEGSHKAFAEDMRAIYENCIAYNHDGEREAHMAGLIMSEKFERLYTSWVVDFERGLSIGPTNQDLILTAPWGEGCKICGKFDNEDLIILCDICNKEYHIYCLKPPLKKVPDTEVWYVHVHLRMPKPKKEIISFVTVIFIFCLSAGFAPTASPLRLFTSSNKS